jgi:hypothetical protein
VVAGGSRFVMVVLEIRGVGVRFHYIELGDGSSWL